MASSKQKPREAHRRLKTHETPKKSIVVQPFILILKMYQLCLSPLLGPHCRFEPSCSHYAIHSLTHHGLLKGSLLALNRLRKCHPWHEGGFDPVPPSTSQCARHQRTHSPSR